MATGGANDKDIHSDETFDLLCCMCKHKNKNTEATKFCVDCQEYYCSSCVKFHDEIPPLSRHKILNKDKFQPGQSQRLQMVPTERCDRHRHKHVDMFCQNHDVVGCSTCIAVDHKSCGNTFFIPDFLQNNTDTLGTKDIDQKLGKAADALTNEYAKFEQEKERLLKSKDTHLEKIKEFRQKANERLDILEQNSISDLEAKYKPELDKLDEEMHQIDTTKVKVLSAKDDLSTAGSNVSQMFVSKKKGTNVVDRTERYIAEIKDEHNVVEIEFVPERKLMVVLNELNLLGQLEASVSDDGQNDNSKSETTAVSMEASNKRQGSTFLKVKEKKHYNVRIPSDSRKCSIYSACVLEDGTIILADHANNKLKRVDKTTYSVTDYCDVSGDLYQVCSISNQEVAVSCGGKKYVQFVSLGNKMVPTKHIKTNHRCDGLAFVDGQLYISDNTTVYIYTVPGTKLQQFNKDQHGQEVFSTIWSLAVSNDGSKIYVADRNNGLISLGSDGKVLAVFNSSELNTAEDVCFTENGNVLVCGYGSKNVVQLTPDCKMIRETLKCNTGVQAICYDAKHSKLIVGLLANDMFVYDVV